MAAGGEATQLLQEWREADASAFHKLVPLVYCELHKIAVSQMRREKDGHTLSPTGLVRESFLRIWQSESVPDWQDRKHCVDQHSPEPQ
jgi:hypothetical protein